MWAESPQGAEEPTEQLDTGRERGGWSVTHGVVGEKSVGVTVGDVCWLGSGRSLCSLDNNPC